MKKKLGIVILGIVIGFAAMQGLASSPSIAFAGGSCPFTGQVSCQVCNPACPSDPGACVAGCVNPFGCSSALGFPPCLPTHKACVNQSCAVVSGAGQNSCASNQDCVTATTVPPPPVAPPVGRCDVGAACCSDSDCPGPNAQCVNKGLLNAAQCATKNLLNLNSNPSPNGSIDTDYAAQAGLPTTCDNMTVGGVTICASPIPSLNSNGIANPAACQALGAIPIDSALEQNVTGNGPIQTDPNSGNFGKTVVTNYSPLYYATPASAQLLAQCLGASVILTTQEIGSPFFIPPTLEITLPNGYRDNAGYLIDRLIVGYGGDVNVWMNALVRPLIGSAGATSVHTIVPVGTVASGGAAAPAASSSAPASAASSIVAIIGGLERSILNFRVSAAAQAQIQNNGNAATSQITATQGLLAALKSSLQNISSSLTTGSATISQSILANVAGLLNTMAQIIAALQAGNVPAATTTTVVTTSGGTAPFDLGAATVGGLSTSTFRYLAIRSQTGAMAWDEIEAYDANGNKIQPLNVDVSTNNTAKAALTDGNLSTGWSDLFVGATPWVVLDYGSVRQFSRVRFLSDVRLSRSCTINDEDDILVSSDKRNFAKVSTFACDFSPSVSQWHEYNFAFYAGDPAITLTVNGGASAFINGGDTITYNLQTANTDYISPSFTGGPVFPAPTINCNYHNFSPFINPIPSQGGVAGVTMSTAGWSNASAGFASTDVANSSMTGLITTASGSYSVGQVKLSGCPVDQKFTLTMTAVQARTGIQRSASVNVTLAGVTPVINQWYPLFVRITNTGLNTIVQFPNSTPYSIFSAPSELNATYTVHIGSNAPSSPITIPVYFITVYPNVSLPAPAVSLVNNSALGVTYVSDVSPIITPESTGNLEIGKLHVVLPANVSLPQQFMLRADGPGGTKDTTVIVQSS